MLTSHPLDTCISMLCNFDDIVKENDNIMGENNTNETRSSSHSPTL